MVTPSDGYSLWYSAQKILMGIYNQDNITMTLEDESSKSEGIQ